LCFRNENVNAYAIFIGSLGMFMHLCTRIYLVIFYQRCATGTGTGTVIFLLVEPEP
jgi:hypothetical protein